MWHPFNRLKRLLTAEVELEAVNRQLADARALYAESVNSLCRMRDQYEERITKLEAQIEAERAANRDRENLLVDRVLTKGQAYGITETKQAKKPELPQESDREKLLAEWFVDDYLEQMNWPKTEENRAAALKMFPRYLEGGFGINPLSDTEM